MLFSINNEILRLTYEKKLQNLIIDNHNEKEFTNINDNYHQDIEKVPFSLENLLTLVKQLQYHYLIKFFHELIYIVHINKTLYLIIGKILFIHI